MPPKVSAGKLWQKTTSATVVMRSRLSDAALDADTADGALFAMLTGFPEPSNARMLPTARAARLEMDQQNLNHCVSGALLAYPRAGFSGKMISAALTREKIMAVTTNTPKNTHPLGYSEMVWAETLDPEYSAVRDELRRVAMSAGALSVKFKEMIVIGILASRGLQYGVAAHMRRAVQYGATRQELFEVLKAAHIPGGGVAYSVGIRALQELEIEGAFKKTVTQPPAKSRRRRSARRTPRSASRRVSRRHF